MSSSAAIETKRARNWRRINRAALRYINATPELLLLLYDLDLLPEQLDDNTRDWTRMVQLAIYHHGRRKREVRQGVLYETESH